MTQKINTPNCQMHELLVTYLYGETAPEESLRFEKHLLDCLSCRQELSAFEGVRESLQQWQFDEVPNVRVVTANAERKSALGLLKELFMIMPLWAKGLGAVALAMLVLAVLGTEVKIGKDGFSYRADVFRKGDPSTAQTGGATGTDTVAVKLSKEQLEQIRAGLMQEVTTLIAQSEQAQKEEVKTQLVNFQTQLKDMRSAELVKIAAQVQQHNLKIQTIEHDIDRREGLGLTDILLGESNTSNERGKTGSDD
ncbi:MAG: zf-HC2 domain-containing protein [Acidobacteria bacterium]|nr:zf-HC2 domain-containing protein [Acidobacteriota bacterium]